MSAGWFDPTLGAWFDETEQEAGWFDGSLVDEESTGGGGSVTHVQSAHGEAGSGVAPTATFSSDVTNGNLLVVVASAYRAGTPPHAFSLGDLTKSSGTATLGTAQLDIQHTRANGSSSEVRVAIWSIPVTGTGSLTLSLAVNAGDYANIAAAEFSGADTTSGRLDTSLSNDAAGPMSASTLVIGDMTSAGAGVFIGGFGGYTSTTTTWTPDAAFTTIYNVGDVAYNASAAIYRIVSGATTDSADCQISALDTPGWAGASVVYKASSGAASFSGSGTPSLPALTASGSGKKGRSGSGTPSLPALTASGTGTKARKGTGAPSLPTLTASGSGSVTSGPATWEGSGAATLPALTASGAGKKARAGTGSANLPTLTASGAGKKARSGSGVADLPALTASGTAEPGPATHSGSGAATLPALVGSGSSPSGKTSEQPSGGWGYYNDAELARIRRRRRELEDEADRLEMALAAEGLVEPAAEVVARFTVREYAQQAQGFSRRTQRAIDYAERAQTALAYQMALRQLQREMDDEEAAITMLLALVA